MNYTHIPTVLNSRIGSVKQNMSLFQSCSSSLDDSTSLRALLKRLRSSVCSCLCLFCSPHCQILFFFSRECVVLSVSVSLPLCVCSLSANSVLTSRRVDPLTVIPLPNLRGVSGELAALSANRFTQMGSSQKPPNPPATVNMESII